MDFDHVELSDEVDALYRRKNALIQLIEEAEEQRDMSGNGELYIGQQRSRRHFYDIPIKRKYISEDAFSASLQDFRVELSYINDRLDEIENNIKKYREEFLDE